MIRQVEKNLQLTENYEATITVVVQGKNTDAVQNADMERWLEVLEAEIVKVQVIAQALMQQREAEKL